MPTLGGLVVRDGGLLVSSFQEPSDPDFGRRSLMVEGLTWPAHPPCPEESGHPCACCQGCPGSEGVTHTYPGAYQVALSGFTPIQGCFALTGGQSVLCTLLGDGLDGLHVLGAVPGGEFATCNWAADVPINYVQRYYTGGCCEAAPAVFTHEVRFTAARLRLYRVHDYAEFRVQLWSDPTGISSEAHVGTVVPLADCRTSFGIALLGGAPCPDLNPCPAPLPGPLTPFCGTGGATFWPVI